MIIDNKTSNLETYGDIEEIQTSINKEDMDFIITLLSSNQYSDPEGSFLREIVSNAWDSHVAANNTDQPVIVKITDSYVSVRDYGTGLSKEQFENIYCKIGSSTKRETNELIGGFGIGKFSSLAVSDSVEIDNYYEGTCYHYIMIKDGNKITTTLVGVEPTDEHNGLCVRVDIDNSYKFLNKIPSLCFFQNVYIVGKNNFNNAKIAKYKNYWVSDLYPTQSILLGTVQYNLKIDFVDSQYRDFCKHIKGLGISFKFNIGELEVTPNREEIIYTEKTINIINSRIKAAYDELLGYYQEASTKDFDDLKEYLKAYEAAVYFDPFNNTFGKLRIYPRMIEYAKFTYKGQKINYEGLDKIGRHFFKDPSFKGIHYNDKWYLKSFPSRYSYKIGYKNIVFVKIGGRLDYWKKDYIAEHYEDKTVVIVEDSSFLDNKDMQNKYWFDTIYWSIWKEYIKESIESPVITKPERKQKVEKPKCTYVHIFSTNMWNSYETKNVIKTVESYNRIVLMTAQERQADLTRCIKSFGYTPIFAAKEVLDVIKKSKLNWIDVDTFLKKKAIEIMLSKDFVRYHTFITLGINQYTDMCFQLTPKFFKIDEKYVPDSYSEISQRINDYMSAYKSVYFEYTCKRQDYSSEMDMWRQNIPALLWYTMCIKYNLKFNNNVINNQLVKLCLN